MVYSKYIDLPISGTIDISSGKPVLKEMEYARFRTIDAARFLMNRICLYHPELPRLVFKDDDDDELEKEENEK